MLEKDRDIYARDARLIDKYQSLKSIYEQDEYYSGGDFSERVSVLLDDIGAKIDSRKGTASAAILSQREITELIYKHPINELRAEVVNYLALKSETWVLVDNLDKGWPGSVVTKGDVVLISCLLEALEKIARSFRQRRYEEFYSVVFLRGDIYENLINTSSDRGKIIPVSVDWSDPSALKELLRKRFVYSKFDDRLEMDHIWEQIAPQQIDGKNSLDFVIEQCLYRPRALVDFVYVCKSIASIADTRKFKRMTCVRRSEDSQFSSSIISVWSFVISIRNTKTCSTNSSTASRHSTVPQSERSSRIS